ncbi:unnamed protein product [Pseudo-nitzschia multistriata]|uniref:Uncharacterized protein n=1 Tax=Pseudo-nitzschia multistriata TaxID=183589 RepID=A0A448ZQV3_9STRA|nr:unnamed protein product [Pseudo-nitzschia multistriata]
MAFSAKSQQPDKSKVFAEDDEEIWKKVVSFQSVEGNSDNKNDTSENDDGGDRVGPLLSSLAERLREDWRSTDYWKRDTEPGASPPNAETYWKSLSASLSTHTKGRFAYSDAPTKAAGEVPASLPGDDALPEAFRAPEGKRHLEATTALLGLPRDRALQVTMGALRSVDTARGNSVAPTATKPTSETDGGSGNDNFSSLLGTRELLDKTLEYHHRQRSARLSVLTECLRLELDPSYPIRGIVQAEFLDPLDQAFQTSGSGGTSVARGLFKSLLIVACRPDPVASREAFEPAKHLTDATSNTGLASSASFRSVADHRFAEELFSKVVAQAKLERTQAMEALLALFYERIDGGISRADYALLLTAFFSSEGSREDRWQQLAGLVCAGCMGLWRAFEQEDSGDQWKAGHPFLAGLGDPSSECTAELEALALLVLEILSSAKPDSSERPQSLALLSYGLLVSLAAGNGGEPAALALTHGGPLSELLWGNGGSSDGSDPSRSLRECGEKLVTLASDEAGAFDCLAETMRRLAGEALSDTPSIVAHDSLYDWQFASSERASSKNPVLMLTDDAGGEATDAVAPAVGPALSTTISAAAKGVKRIPADVVAYTSIAREVLAASIATFSDSLLAIDRQDSCQNIGMLCQLAAIVFGNNEPLCSQFWESWECYLPLAAAGPANTLAFPMCRLLDASYNLAREYLAGFFQGKVPREEYLLAVAPFLGLLSALCHDPSIAESMVEMLPQAMIRMALVCSFCDAPADVDPLETRTGVLGSIERLTRVATSSMSCLERLRMALEDTESLAVSSMETEQGGHSFDGPRLLASILHDPKDHRIARSVLGIIANLLEGAPNEWAILMAGQFIDRRSGFRSTDSPTSRLVPFLSTKDEALSHSAILVLAELVGHLSPFVFCGSEALRDSSTILSFLQSLGAALLTAMTGLATTRISTASVETAEIVFQSFAGFLGGIRPVIRLHESPEVREGATQIRDWLVQTLATSNGLGEVLVYYATAPVSLGLVAKMEETITDQSIAEQVAKDDVSESAKKYGAWYSFSSNYKGQSSGIALSKSRVLEFLSGMTPGDFDLEGIQARGWVKDSNPNGVATLDAAWSSIRLLSEWASHVEDIAETHLETPLCTKQEFPLEGEANDIITKLSPQRLLCTAASMPILPYSDSRLSSLWQSLNLSAFDLLLPYLHHSTEGEQDPNLPLSIVLNLLNTCIAQATFTLPKAKMADSLLLRILVQSARFPSLLKDIVERGIRLAGEGDPKRLAETNKQDFLNAFLGLQILSCCVASAPTVADVVLNLKESSGLVDKLVEGALFAPGVLDLSGSQAIFSTEGSILRMRMAAGCASVLSTLWKNIRFLSQGTASDKEGSSLWKEVDRQSVFISKLVEFVSQYANTDNLDKRIDVSNETEFARVSTMSFMTSAFEIITNAHVYESSKEGQATSSTTDVLKKFSKCRRLIRAENYSMSVRSTKEIWEIAKDAGLKQQDPAALLSSFPAVSSTLQPNNFYRKENSFDLSSLAKWLKCIGGAEMDDDDYINDALDKASLLHHLTASESSLMEAWKHFLEIAIFNVYYSNGCVITGSNMQILKNMTLETLFSLNDNLASGAAAQTGSSTPFMSREICQMSSSLGDLFLFQLEIGAFDLLPLDELLKIATALSESMKSLQDVSCPRLTGESESNPLLQEYCTQHQTLLSCALVICGLIEKHECSRPDHGEQGDIYTSLCLTNCTFVRAFSQLCNKKNISAKTNTTIIRSCASLFTFLVIGYQSDHSSDSSYTNLLSKSFHEYEVLKLLMQYATYLSSFVEKNLSSSKNQIPSEEDRDILEAIKAVFNLLYAIADTNDPEIISTLYAVEFSQLAVRNPLFNLRGPSWSQQDQMQAQPRGYIFKRETVMISNEQSSIYVGSEDSVYEIWLASMQVLGACVRTSSHYLNKSGSNDLSTGFLEMAIEFLRVHRSPLLACLQSCVQPSKMTRLALREAKELLAMVAELCKRNVRKSFVSSNLDLCEEFIEHTKVVTTSLSKFLGAVGTSCELFATIEEYESTDQDRFDDLKSAPLSQLRLSLLSIGLPMAKQKAMRLSNFAASRLEKISQDDFQAATVVPDHFKSLCQKRVYESESERICRQSVSNEFSLDLVKASAECICQALSLVLRTHAMSKSFYVFSEADRAIDVMNLVEPGIVIGYRPNVGQIMLFGSSGFGSLRFGRVLSVDTFSRTWEVVVLRQEGNNDYSEVHDGRRETVQAVQLAGIEDRSARKPSTSLLSPAPDTMASFEKAPGFLTTGNYIMLLRWCHQQSTLLRGGEDASSEPPPYVRQIAEQASILLGADLVLHELTGSFEHKDPKEMAILDDQLFELFADGTALVENAKNDSDLENEEPSAVFSFQEGRLREVIDSSVWNGLQGQVLPFVKRAWKVRKETERKQKEKQISAGGSTFFSSGFRRTGKSSFRR